MKRIPLQVSTRNDWRCGDDIKAAVAAAIPYGRVSVTAVTGGLDISNENPVDESVIASAAFAVQLDSVRRIDHDTDPGTS